jgi:hypothetical protein
MVVAHVDAVAFPTDGAVMKFLVIGVVVLFVGFWMVQDPGGLATLTKDGAGWLWGVTQTVFGAVIDFTGQLLG